ncbi:hypothetical protein BTVI_18741 [Pitangus sulphuratus]|nr:hypothetical protein BTVI_18741 [Pitangus sulphuratus]
MPDSPFSEGAVPNIQPKPPLVKTETVSSVLSLVIWEKKPNPHLAPPSCQGVVESDGALEGFDDMSGEQPHLSQPDYDDPVIFLRHHLMKELLEPEPASRVLGALSLEVSKARLDGIWSNLG